MHASHRFPLAGPPRVVLITGTSRGVGAYLAHHLRREGHRVYGSSRGGHPDDPWTLELNVTSVEQCERAAAQVLAREGRIDVLINNAGLHLHGAALEVGEDELRAQLELNFHGSVNMTRAVVPVMLDARWGRIINMSSVGGRLATPFTSAYAASKFALEGYMEALRLELLHTGIFVSNLEPGFLRTGTTEHSIVATRGTHGEFTPARRLAHERMLAQAPHGAPLEKVARSVSKILAAPHPRLRYSVDSLLVRLTWLQRLLGVRLFERMVLRSTAPTLGATP